MSKKKRTPARRGNRRAHGPGTRVREWVGGRLTLPVYINEAVPFRPEMALWLELPDDFVVGQELVDPNGPPLSFGDTLLHAMAAPAVGPPRSPKRIRVSDAHLAMELRGVVPDVDVVVAPTPELDRLIAHMVASMPGDGPSNLSYFEDGRVGADAVEALFQAACALFRSAPWELVQDSRSMRLDIPALGVEGACVSIIGALGESLGLVIFPSHLAMEQFLSGVDTDRPRDEPLDMGTTTLSLNFERGADLPAGMRREAAEHGWPVAGATAYPWVQHRDRDGTMRPLGERDVRVVSACAGAIAAFFSKHSEHFEQDSPEPVHESFVETDGVEVRLAMPYEAREADDPPASGDGRSSQQAVPVTADRAPSAAELHEIDGRLVESMMDFAQRRFGDGWPRAARNLSNRAEAVGLLGPFLVYQVQLKGKTIAHWFAKQNGSRLSNTERTWLRAQQTAWLSVWEVRAVEPGRSLKLEDLLTGEVRDVQEIGASKTLVARYAILARVVDYEGLSLLCGVHARPLAPREAAQVVAHARTSLRRKGADPRSRLREQKMGRYLIARWEDALDALDARPVTLPRLQNTDGEDLLLTIDRFAFDPALRGEVEACLATIDGVQPPQEAESEGCYRFNRPGNAMHASWESTILASAWIGDGKLRVETNSIARADRIRERIETACGERIRHRAREHQDPVVGMGKHGAAAGPGAEASGLSSDEANAAILEFKKRHYANWPGQSLPTLGGDTPRAAVRTQTGREQVDMLLKECELMEAQHPEGQRFDFSDLRRELGLRD